MSGPNPPATRERRLRPTVTRVIVLLLLYSSVASFAVSEFLRYPGLASAKAEFGGEDFFGDMVYGRAPLPYVTRVLVPWLIRAAGAVTAPAARAQLEESVRRTQTTDGKPGWLYRYPFEFIMAKNIILLFAIGFAFAFWWLARLTLDVPAPVVDAIPVLTLLALPGLYGHASHLYDFPALCLFTLGLALIAARRLRLYVIVFVAAVLNKETALLLTFIWVIVERRRLNRSRLLTGLVLQVAVWGLIRGGLLLLFRGNPGQPIALHLFRNAQTLSVPGNWFGFRAVADWLVLPTGFNLLYVLGFIASLFALKKAPQFLKDAFWVAVPVFVLTWLFGNVDEMRVYYELLPIVALVLFSGLYGLMGYTVHPRVEEAGRAWSAERVRARCARHH